MKREKKDRRIEIVKGLMSRCKRHWTPGETAKVSHVGNTVIAHCGRFVLTFEVQKPEGREPMRVDAALKDNVLGSIVLEGKTLINYRVLDNFIEDSVKPYVWGVLNPADTGDEREYVSKAFGFIDEESHPRNQVVVFEEKHGTRYFLVDGRGPGAVFLKVFQSRDKDGYWYGHLKDLGKDAQPPAEIPPLPEEVKDDPDYAKTHAEKVKQHKREMEWFLDEQEQRAWYLKAKGGDARAARCFLELREDAQYEGFTIRRLEVG